jgi:putative intracellular protease/amidase
MFILRTAIFALLVAFVAAPVFADGWTVSNDAEAYYGSTSEFSSPATVDTMTVFKEIAVYREILRRGLTEEDALYYHLIRKASDIFLAAVEKVAKAKEYDLVVSPGGVSSETDVAPDITQAVIDALK